MITSKHSEHLLMNIFINLNLQSQPRSLQMDEDITAVDGSKCLGSSTAQLEKKFDLILVEIQVSSIWLYMKVHVYETYLITKSLLVSFTPLYCHHKSTIVR